MLNHPIFDKPSLKRAVSKGLHAELTGNLIDAAVEAVFGVVEDAFNLNEVSDLSLDAMFLKLKIMSGNTLVNEPYDPVLSARILDEIMNRENGPERLATLIDDFYTEQRLSDDRARRVVSASDPVKCALGEFDRVDAFARGSWADNDTGSSAARAIRSCFRSPQDGKRVSREPHEWAYVRGESAQWQQMIDAVKWYDDNTFSGGEALANANVPLDVEGYTYGNFVDLAKCRKAVAAIRKVRRLVRKANVREILSIVGQDVEQLTTELVRSIDFTDQINELTAYFGD